MAPASAAKSKAIYRPFGKLEVFYTGGAVKSTVDEKSIVCSCGDEVKVVGLETGSVSRIFPGDTEPITSIAVSPNGRHIFAASRSLSTKCWDLHTGQCHRTWRAHKTPTADMAVDSSGGLVATASADKEVRVWDVAGGFCTHAFSGHSGVVLKVLFHPRQLLLVTAGDDGLVLVWDLVDKKLAATLKAHYSAVTSLAWSADGWKLLSGGRDKIVVVWDIQTYAKAGTIPVFEAIESLVVLPSSLAVPGGSVATSADALKGINFASAGEDGLIKVWNSGLKAQIYKQPRAAGSLQATEITELILLPVAQCFLSASVSCRIAQLRLSHRGLTLKHQLLGNPDEVTSLRFVGQAVHSSSLTIKSDPTMDGVQPLALPTRLAVASNSDQIHVLACANMNCEVTLAGHTDTVLCLASVAVQNKPDRWVLASGSKDNNVRIWHAASGRCIAIGTGHLSAVSAVSFASKGAPFLLSGSVDKLARVWSLSDVWTALAADKVPDQPIKLSVTSTVSAHDKDINCVAVAPNNSLAATASQDRTAKLWRLPALSAPIVLKGHKRGIWDVCFSPVDTVVLTASGDATIRIWNSKDGACMKTLTGHDSSVLRASFLSMGTQVVSTGGDGLLKLWSIRTGECIKTHEAHDDKVWALDVAGPNDDVVVTGGSDASIILWADCTAADDAKQQAVDDDRLSKQQDLSNALADKNYLRAARLAFQLHQPGRLLDVIKATLHDKSGSVSASQQVLARLVKAFTIPEVVLSMTYLRDWNTSARNCHCAQALLHAVFTNHHPSTLLDAPGMQDIVDALALYTDRHYKRMDRLLESTFLLDYLLASMLVLEQSVDDPTTAVTRVDGVDCFTGAASNRYVLGLGRAEDEESESPASSEHMESEIGDLLQSIDDLVGQDDESADDANDTRKRKRVPEADVVSVLAQMSNDDESDAEERGLPGWGDDGKEDDWEGDEGSPQAEEMCTSRISQHATVIDDLMTSIGDTGPHTPSSAVVVPSGTKKRSSKSMSAAADVSADLGVDALSSGTVSKSHVQVGASPGPVQGLLLSTPKRVTKADKEGAAAKQGPKSARKVKAKSSKVEDGVDERAMKVRRKSVGGAGIKKGNRLKRTSL